MLKKLWLKLEFLLSTSDDILSSHQDAKIKAEEIGLPVMLKASSGGGGRGMRFVKEMSEIENAYKSANQALTAFGDSNLYIEKFIENPRHIEVQILSDQNGNYTHLGERECSIQRRHQKLIEESPSPIVDQITRKRIGDAAIRAAKAVNYVGVGTIEFLMDRNKDFYFMEMNTRIQVEHPVTEMVTGVDLIKQQIKMHAGHSCPEFLTDFKPRGPLSNVELMLKIREITFYHSLQKLQAFIEKCQGGFSRLLWL